MKSMKLVAVRILVVLITIVCSTEIVFAVLYEGIEPPSGEQLKLNFNAQNLANGKPWRATKYLGRVKDNTYDSALMYFYAVEATGRRGLKKSIEDIRVVRTDLGTWLVFVGGGQKYVLEK